MVLSALVVSKSFISLAAKASVKMIKMFQRMQGKTFWKVFQQSQMLMLALLPL